MMVTDWGRIARTLDTWRGGGMADERHDGKLRDRLAAIAFVVVCFAAGGVGQLLSGGEPGEWYAALQKPAFNPPSWVFGPVWTVLYLLMGLAAWRIWLKRGTAGVALALSVFALQLILNAAWTGLFFGLRNPALAFGELLVLYVGILLTIWFFSRVSKPAAWMLIPYLAWVSFATILNLAVWRLNV
jgi:tryptophan-rich sensory protein